MPTKSRSVAQQQLEEEILEIVAQAKNPVMLSDKWANKIRVALRKKRKP